MHYLEPIMTPEYATQDPSATVMLSSSSSPSPSREWPAVTQPDDATLPGTTKWDMYVDDDFTNKWFFFVTLALGVAGTLGNAMVIGAVLVHRPLRRLPNAFIVNLACADLCISAVIQFATLDAILRKGEFFRERPALCDLFGLICTTSCTCSLWSITAISINRYVCICHNADYHRIYTPAAKVAAMIVGVWVGCFLLDLPALLGWGAHSYDPKVMFCTFDYTASLSYTLFLVGVGVGCPILLVSYCYVRILLFVRASRRTLRRLSRGSAGNCMMSVGRGKGGIKARDLTLLRTVVILWVVFIIMWAPYTVYVLFDTENTWNRTLFVVFVNLCHANSSINCVIYAATNPTFRRGYVVFVRRLLCLKKPAVAEKKHFNSRNVSHQCPCDIRQYSYTSNILTTRDKILH